MRSTNLVDGELGGDAGLAHPVRADERDELLREIPAPEPDPDVGPPATPSDLRAAAYRAEADPLYFMAQRGEATMEAWLNKIAEIKARYPN